MKSEKWCEKPNDTKEMLENFGQVKIWLTYLAAQPENRLETQSLKRRIFPKWHNTHHNGLHLSFVITK